MLQAATGPQEEVQSVEAAHAALRARKDLQFDFPELEIEPPPDPPGWLQALADAIGSFFGGLGPVTEVLFWGLVAAAVMGLVYLIAREAGWIAWSPKARKTKPKAEEYHPEAEMARALLADADELARAGRFAEAVHVLLLRSVEDMHRLRPRAVRPAATSRDIATLELLPAAARSAFSAMARMVETSLFGGRPVDAEGYAEARKAYADFAFPQVWS